MKKAFADGCDKVVLILTKPEGTVRADSTDRKLARVIRRRYPKAAEQLALRAQHYNEGIALAEQLAAEGKVLIIAPDGIAAYFVIGFIGQMAALVTAVFVAFHGYKYLNNTGFSAASFFGPDNTLGVIVLTLLAVFALIAIVDALLWALTQWLMTKRLNLA